MCQRTLYRPQEPVADEFVRSFGAPDMHPAVNKIRKLTSVSFSETVLVQFSIALNDYADDEYVACWYSPDEYDEIERDMFEDFQKMEDGQPLDNNSCSRGLEQYLTVNAIPRQANVRESIKAVLDEQDRQFELEDYSDEAISKAYQNISSSCRMWATTMGHRDEKAATCAYEDENAGDFEDLSPSNNTLVNNHKLHDATGSMTTFLKGAVDTMFQEPNTAFVSSLLLPLIMEQGVAFCDGRCI